MRTWSLESAVVKAYSAVAVRVQGLLDFGAGLEQLTRPPRRPFADDDETLAVSPDGYYGYAEPNLDGADRLAEREAEIDAHEPRQCQTHPRTGWELRTPGSANPHKVCNMCDSPIPDTDFNYCDYHRTDDTPAEPSLSDDELVGVRGLLQERYSDQRCTCPSWGNPSWPHRHDCPAKPDLRGGNHTGAAAQPDSPAAGAVGTSSPEACGIPPSPSGERSQWSDLADRMVEHLPSVGGERPNLESLYVLATYHITKHRRDRYIPQNDAPLSVRCKCGEYFPDGGADWSRHVGEVVIDAVLERQSEK